MMLLNEDGLGVIVTTCAERAAGRRTNEATTTDKTVRRVRDTGGSRRGMRSYRHAACRPVSRANASGTTTSLFGYRASSHFVSDRLGPSHSVSPDPPGSPSPLLPGSGHNKGPG